MSHRVLQVELTNALSLTRTYRSNSSILGTLYD